MNTEAKNFPVGKDVKDLLYLLHLDMQSVLSVLSPAHLEVTDIEKLSNAQLDKLQVGDAVVKVTGNQKHLYLVTYKGEGAGEGIVLTYNACGYGEAIAYDRVDGGWEFNSKEVKTYGE